MPGLATAPLASVAPVQFAPTARAAQEFLKAIMTVTDRFEAALLEARKRTQAGIDASPYLATAARERELLIAGLAALSAAATSAGAYSWVLRFAPGLYLQPLNPVPKDMSKQKLLTHLLGQLRGLPWAHYEPEMRTGWFAAMNNAFWPWAATWPVIAQASKDLAVPIPEHEAALAALFQDGAPAARAWMHRFGGGDAPDPVTVEFELPPVVVPVSVTQLTVDGEQWTLEANDALRPKCADAPIRTNPALWNVHMVVPCRSWRCPTGYGFDEAAGLCVKAPPPPEPEPPAPRTDEQAPARKGVGWGVVLGAVALVAGGVALFGRSD